MSQLTRKTVGELRAGPDIRAPDPSIQAGAPDLLLKVAESGALVPVEYVVYYICRHRIELGHSLQRRLRMQPDRDGI